MAFRLPNFNLLADAWSCSTTPFADAPTWTDLSCQKYIPNRMVHATTPPYQGQYWVEWFPPTVMRMDRTQSPFDVPWVGWQVGILEVPKGSGQYYRVTMSDIIHEGFPNEYAILVTTQCDLEGRAFQPPSGSIATGYGESPCP
jgi:hypothetical protein